MFFNCGSIVVVLLSVLFLELSVVTTLEPATTEGFTSPDPQGSNAPISIEILCIYVPDGAANSVKLIWGPEYNRQPSTNLTYAVHYGTEENELNGARLTTGNLSATIKDLEYCKKYLFAVSVVANGELTQINTNNVRSIVTQINRMEPPQDLQVEFEPSRAQEPCLQIKWDASCASIGEPIGYVISALEKRSSRYTIVNVPPSRQANFVYNFKVDYNTKFHIKVATNFPGSQTTDTVIYKVPGFLQPYKVKITSNPDGAFMIYWSEPFVPYYVGQYYYEVHIYNGPQISSDFEKYYVTRPVLVYKGNSTVYTFIVGLVSYDKQYRSLFTKPIVANINGDTRELEPDDDDDDDVNSNKH